MKRQLFLFPALLAVVLLMAGGCASNKPPPERPSFFAFEQHTSNSEVVSVDAPARLITLREEGDEPKSYKVSDSVRNLDQVRAGDRVMVGYYETISIRVLPPGTPVNGSRTTLKRSEPGEKPGGYASRSVTSTVEVEGVYPAQSEVVTRNPAGTLKVWKVKDAKKLNGIQSGDRAELTYAEMLAVSVTPAPAGAAAAPAGTAAPAGAADQTAVPAGASSAAPAKAP